MDAQVSLARKTEGSEVVATDDGGGRTRGSTLLRLQLAAQRIPDAHRRDHTRRVVKITVTEHLNCLGRRGGGGGEGVDRERDLYFKKI